MKYSNMPEPIRLHHLKVLKNPLKILELSTKIQNTSMDKNAIAVAKYYEAKAWLLIGIETIVFDEIIIRRLNSEKFRNFNFQPNS